MIGNSLVAQSLSVKLESYQASHHLEKIYIAHDKPYYPIGDTIWCKAYYLDAKSHQVNNLSPLLLVDWIDPGGDIKHTLTLKVNEGTALFEIPVDPLFKSGSYTLRAYTHYQKNFDPAFVFQKKIKILDRKSTDKDTLAARGVSLKLYPEGGELVAGMANCVAYEITGDTVFSADSKIVVKDDSGNLIIESKLEQGSLGKFHFKPAVGKKYNFTVKTNEKEFSADLPEVLDDGFVLSVNGSDKEYIYLSVNANPEKLLNGAQLIGHVRGDVFVNKTLVKDGPKTFRLERNQIPSGILHFTLFSANGKPVSERLCFNYNVTSDIEVKLVMDKEKYFEREQITMSVMTSSNNDIVPSKFSVSAYNEDFFQRGNENLNIVNYLLLQSDLKFPILDINKHFTNQGVKNHYLLDLEMMTKTWRRFKWQDILDEKNPEIKYGTQEDIQFLGIVKEKDKPVKANVSFFAAGEDLVNAEMVTGDDGVFYFKELSFKDTTQVFINASKYKERKSTENRNNTKKKKQIVKNISIEYFPLDSLEVKLPKTEARANIEYAKKIYSENLYEAEESQDFAERKLQYELLILDSLRTAEWSIDIEEIVIKDSKKIKLDERRIEMQELYKQRGWKPTNIPVAFYLDDIPGALESYDVFNMITRVVPSVNMVVQPNGDRGIVQRQGFSLSDVLIGQPGESIGGFEIPEGPSGNPIPPRPGTNLAFPILVDYQNNRFQAERIDPKKLFAMEVRYDIWGNIVYINLISRDPNDKEKGSKFENILNIVHPGYYEAREFYQPVYSSDDELHNIKPDLRTTLYWNPDVKISDNAAELKFSTGDRKGNYVIFIEGISDLGIPFIHKKQFVVF